MFDIPDAYDMWVEYDREQSQCLDRLPRCFHCGEPIQQEMAVCLDGAWMCDECIKNNMEEVIIDE